MFVVVEKARMSIPWLRTPNQGIRDKIGEGLLTQADHPMLVGAVVD